VFPLSVKAVNVGKAVWLARGEQNTGAVQLEWRWFWKGTEVPGLSGRAGLPYDVFSGQQYEYTTSITPPGWPEDYVLEVGLISASVTRFSEQGIEPVRIVVHVVNSISGAFDKSLAAHVTMSDDPPQLAITTDRPRYQHTDILRVLVSLANVNRVQTVDAYLALIGPDGQLSFRTGTGLSIAPQGSWLPLITGVTLPKGAQFPHHPLLKLRFGELPNGCFSLYLILTAPNTSTVIAKSQAFFMLEP
jgi:hypothetical protein